jgi:hypothetical protein
MMYDGWIEVPVKIKSQSINQSIYQAIDASEEIM